MFLSTPHHGTTLAEQLNSLLGASFLHSPKPYIAEMRSNGSYLSEINEEFRNVAPRLQMFSFYETQSTMIGPRQIVSGRQNHRARAAYLELTFQFSEF